VIYSRLPGSRETVETVAGLAPHEENAVKTGAGEIAAGGAATASRNTRLRTGINQIGHWRSRGSLILVYVDVLRVGPAHLTAELGIQN
jgi:hypothetical protein